MKSIKVDRDKVRMLLRDFIKTLPILSIVILIITFAILTLIAITPAEDTGVMAEGGARAQSLDVRFNQKLLDQLANTAKPTTVGESGGRDPFSPF